MRKNLSLIAFNAKGGFEPDPYPINDHTTWTSITRDLKLWMDAFTLKWRRYIWILDPVWVTKRLCSQRTKETPPRMLVIPAGEEKKNRIVMRRFLENKSSRNTFGGSNNTGESCDKRAVNRLSIFCAFFFSFFLHKAEIKIICEIILRF